MRLYLFSKYMEGGGAHAGYFPAIAHRKHNTLLNDNVLYITSLFI